MAENITFVTIDLNRKQVNTDNPVHNDKTGKDYARVFAPGNGTFLYPLSSIKVRSDNPERVYFSRPEGTEIQVQYSRRKENVPDSAPNEEKYENFTKTWKIEELKSAYEEERRIYAENHGFVNCTVPTAWGKEFVSGDKKFVSISVPVPEKDSDKDLWCSFILPEDRFKPSEKNEGMSYFGFPKKKKDTPEDYMVKLRYSVSVDGEYQDREMEISSVQLKEYLDKAVSRSEAKDLFVSTTISAKLVREFESKEGKKLCAISVPMYGMHKRGTNQNFFYEIVVPKERIKEIPGSESQVRLSLFRHTPDGEDYTFTAKHSFDNGEGGFDTETKTLTSEDVIDYFEWAREEYKKNHEKNNDQTLADAVAAHYGVELRNVLTGFKWIGDQIAQLEAAGEVDRFIFGFEESYGYLAGPYVRDKDAVIASMLICEMAAYYRSIGSSLKQRLEEIYAEYGRYLNKIDSFEFPGLSGMDKMSGIMQNLRENAPAEIAGYKVTEVTDYTKTEETGLPAANVLVYKLENNETVIVRPSGTEPKIKIYYTTLGNDLAEAQAEKDKLAEALKPIMA